MNILELFRAECARLAREMGVDASRYILVLPLPDTDQYIKGMEDQISVALDRANKLESKIDRLNYLGSHYAKDAEAALIALARHNTEMQEKINFYQSLSAKTINLQNQTGISLRISTDANGNMLFAPGVDHKIDTAGDLIATDYIRAELYDKLSRSAHNMGYPSVTAALEDLEELKANQQKPLASFIAQIISGEAGSEDYFMGLKFSDRSELPIEFKTISCHVAVSAVPK